MEAPSKTPKQYVRYVDIDGRTHDYPLRPATLAGVLYIAEVLEVNVNDILGDQGDVTMVPSDVIEVVTTIYASPFDRAILDTNIIDCRAICIAGLAAYVKDAQHQWFYQPDQVMAPTAEA